MSADPLNDLASARRRIDELSEAQRLLVVRLQRVQDRMIEAEAERRQEQRRARKQHGKAIAAAQREMRDQLAYRFGRTLIAAFRNPLKLLILPYSLLRQWRSFRRAAKRAGDRNRGQDEAAAPPAREEEFIGPALARAMTDEALAQLAPRAFADLANRAREEGDLHLQMRIAGLRWEVFGYKGDGSSYRLKRGQLIELDTGWLPVLKRRPDYKGVEGRILHIFKTLYPLESTGGAVRNWSILANQKAQGMDPVAAVTPTCLPGEMTVHNRGRDGVVAIERDGVPCYFGHFANMDRSLVPADVRTAFDAKLLGTICDEARPSIVHAASGFRGFDNALKGLALARSRNLPLVYEVRSFHEHTWGPLRDGILEAPQTRMRIAQENRCMAEADVVVTISEAMARELALRGVEQDRLFVVPNAVDKAFLAQRDQAAIERFRTQWGLGNKSVIGYVSNISSREGHAVLVEAFARLHAADSDRRLLIVGDGSGRDDVEMLVEQRGLSGAVVFTGIVDHQEIPAAYGAIDLFVVPRMPDYASDYVTPMKPFEAMAIGCPLIMSDRPVAREILGNEERGRYFATGDAEDLVRIAEEVLADRQGTAARAAVAREWVAAERQWSNVIRRYAEIYQAARAHHTRRREAAE